MQDNLSFIIGDEQGRLSKWQFTWLKNAETFLLRLFEDTKGWGIIALPVLS